MTHILYIYELNTEDFVVISMKARILKENIFSFATNKGKISKSAIGQVRSIDKGNHTNYIYITDQEIEDSLELFTRALHQERKKWTL